MNEVECCATGLHVVEGSLVFVFLGDTWASPRRNFCHDKGMEGNPSCEALSARSLAKPRIEGV